MAKLLKAVKYLVLAFVLATGMYLFAALLLSLLPYRTVVPGCEPNTQVFIGSNGVHLDVIVPVNSLGSNFAKQLQLPPGTQYVAFGWGDRNFYLYTPQWKDLTVPTAFKALFLKSQSAVHVTAFGQKRAYWRETTICAGQLQKLIQYIFNSFYLDNNESIVPIGVKGYGYNDRFYEARGSFSLFTTCNVWINTALKETGIPTSLWLPFDFGVLYHFPE